jgi:hypothetical protein
MRGDDEIVSPTSLELFLYRCKRLKLDVTFMSAGLEFVGVWGSSGNTFSTLVSGDNVLNFGTTPTIWDLH